VKKLYPNCKAVPCRQYHHVFEVISFIHKSSFVNGINIRFLIPIYIYTHKYMWVWILYMDHMIIISTF
jgi:hypothetical protein